MSSPHQTLGTQIGSFLRRVERRRGHRIDPAFQTRFRILLLGFSVAILFSVGALVTGVRFVLENPDAVPASGWVPASFFLLALAIGFAIVRLSDRISHRYCGPVRRICWTLEAVQRGERPSPIRLRKGDEFQELAEAVNAALHHLDALDPHP